MTLLQYVDDLLLAAAMQEECKQATVDLLRELGCLGYQASAMKAQIAQQEVRYLGYCLRWGQRWLTPEMTDCPVDTATQIHARGERIFGVSGILPPVDTRVC